MAGLHTPRVQRRGKTQIGLAIAEEANAMSLLSEELGLTTNRSCSVPRRAGNLVSKSETGDKSCAHAQLGFRPALLRRARKTFAVEREEQRTLKPRAFHGHLHRPARLVGAVRMVSSVIAFFTQRRGGQWDHSMIGFRHLGKSRTLTTQVVKRIK